MTDRLKGLLIALAEDIREDDAQPIIDAIKMIKGVLNVTPIVKSSDDWLARERVREEFREGILKLLFPDKR